MRSKGLPEELVSSGQPGHHLPAASAASSTPRVKAELSAQPSSNELSMHLLEHSLECCKARVCSSKSPWQRYQSLSAASWRQQSSQRFLPKPRGCPGTQSQPGAPSPAAPGGQGSSWLLPGLLEKSWMFTAPSAHSPQSSPFWDFRHSHGIPVHFFTISMPPRRHVWGLLLQVCCLCHFYPLFAFSVTYFGLHQTLGLIQGRLF